MDLGLAFDDEDLQSAKKINRDDTNVPYNVKLCTPRWFESALELHLSAEPSSSPLNPDQIPHTFKFSGDLHYHHENYETAAQQYKLALDLLAENNASVRQDLRESLCRCYMHLDLTEESLQLARELVEEMMQQDEAHQRQSLILMIAVCEKAEKWSECVEHLEKLCCLHPFYAQLWNQLGDAYMKLCEKTSTTSPDLPKVDRTDSMGNTTLTEQYVRPLTCYVRARLFYQVSLASANSFIKSRNEELIDQINKKLDRIPVCDSQKALALQHIRGETETQPTDLKNSGEDGDRNESASISANQDGADVASSTSEVFYNRFCSWYLKMT